MVCLGDGPNVLTFPAEPVAELAERIQSIDGFSSNDFFLGYTNGLEGYLPTDKYSMKVDTKLNNPILCIKNPLPLLLERKRRLLILSRSC